MLEAPSVLSAPHALLKRMTRELFNALAMRRDGNKRNRSRPEMRDVDRAGRRSARPSPRDRIGGKPERCGIPAAPLSIAEAEARAGIGFESRALGKVTKTQPLALPSFVLSSPFSLREIRGIALSARRNHLSPLRVNIPVTVTVREDRYYAIASPAGPPQRGDEAAIA